MAILTIRFDLRQPQGIDSLTPRYRACLEMCEWAERNGFLAVVLSEHHGSDDGYLPAIFPMAAAVAARTERVLISLAAVVAPLHDPLRLAEDAAVVDQLSGGRLALVLANGYVPSEFEMFGVPLRERGERVRDTVEVLRRAWTGEPFEHRGRTARVTPRPAQPNGPMLMLGGASAAAARRAAELGVGFMPSLHQYWADYRDACAELGRPDPGPGMPDQPMFIHVAEDVEAAWAKVGPAVLHEFNAYGRWAAESAAHTGYQPVADLDTLRSFGLHHVLTPAECVEFVDRTGTLLLNPMCGGLEPDVAWESLRLIEHEVLPNVTS